MWLIVLEAMGALALFLFLMWWTMFSGRANGELPDLASDHDTAGAVKEADAGAAESSADVAATDATAPIAGERCL